MNACVMFYDVPCKSALRMVQMLKGFANFVVNLTNMWRMKREHDAWVFNLPNTHYECFSLSYIGQHLSTQLTFLQIYTHCPHLSCILRKCHYE